MSTCCPQTFFLLVKQSSLCSSNTLPNKPDLISVTKKFLIRYLTLFYSSKSEGDHLVSMRLKVYLSRRSSETCAYGSYLISDIAGKRSVNILPWRDLWVAHVCVLCILWLCCLTIDGSITEITVFCFSLNVLIILHFPFLVYLCRPGLGYSWLVGSWVGERSLKFVLLLKSLLFFFLKLRKNSG